jgi:hypothetical protein
MRTAIPVGPPLELKTSKRFLVPHQGMETHVFVIRHPGDTLGAASSRTLQPNQLLAFAEANQKPWHAPCYAVIRA